MNVQCKIKQVMSDRRRTVPISALLTTAAFISAITPITSAVCQTVPPGSAKFSVLYSFTGGSDGGSPQAGLVSDTSGNLYGTTELGGDPTAMMVPVVERCSKSTRRARRMSILHSRTEQMAPFLSEIFFLQTMGRYMVLRNMAADLRSVAVAAELCSGLTTLTCTRFCGGSVGRTAITPWQVWQWTERTAWSGQQSMAANSGWEMYLSLRTRAPFRFFTPSTVGAMAMYRSHDWCSTMRALCTAQRILAAWGIEQYSN